MEKGSAGERDPNLHGRTKPGKTCDWRRRERRGKRSLALVKEKKTVPPRDKQWSGKKKRKPLWDWGGGEGGGKRGGGERGADKGSCSRKEYGKHSQTRNKETGGSGKKAKNSGPYLRRQEKGGGKEKPGKKREGL